MLKTVEAEIDEEGRLRAEEGVSLTPGTKVLITVLNEPPEPALLSESALAKDWLRPEEEAAWSHFTPQSVP